MGNPNIHLFKNPNIHLAHVLPAGIVLVCLYPALAIGIDPRIPPERETKSILIHLPKAGPKPSCGQWISSITRTTGAEGDISFASLCSGLAGYPSVQSKAEQTLQVSSKKNKEGGGSRCYYWCPIVVVTKKSTSSDNLLLVLPETTNTSDCFCKNSQRGADWHHVNVTLPPANAKI